MGSTGRDGVCSVEETGSRLVDVGMVGRGEGEPTDDSD